MKKYVLLVFLAFALSSCNAQEKKENDRSSASVELPEKIFEPKGTWTVNKELDENGNLIRYDSTYSYSYGTLNGDTVKIEDMDSVIGSFRNYFKDKIPSIWKEDFSNPFFEGTDIQERFMEDDFFQNRWHEDFMDMNLRMKHMDSLRERFFKKFYPDMNVRKKPKDSLPQ